ILPQPFVINLHQVPLNCQRYHLLWFFLQPLRHMPRQLSMLLIWKPLIAVSATTAMVEVISRMSAQAHGTLSNKVLINPRRIILAAIFLAQAALRHMLGARAPVHLTTTGSLLAIATVHVRARVLTRAHLRIHAL